jgi:hypothetical protein
MPHCVGSVGRRQDVCAVVEQEGDSVHGACGFSLGCDDAKCYVHGEIDGTAVKRSVPTTS